MKRNCGFTLIEMLTVIAVILVILGIGVPTYNSWRNRSRIAKAKADIAKLELALEMYKTDFGVYPADNLGDLITAAAGDSGKGPYIKSSDYDSDAGAFKDPWGRDYIYANNNEIISITSNGPRNDIDTDNITNIGYGD